MSKFVRTLNAKRLAAFGALAAFGSSAFAALGTSVTTELGTMKTDGVEMATLVLGAIIAVAAVMFLRKCIR